MHFTVMKRVLHTLASWRDWENGWWMEALFIVFLGYIINFIYFCLGILSPVHDYTWNFVVFLYKHK